MVRASTETSAAKASASRFFPPLLSPVNIQRARYMTLETIASIGHDDLVKLPSEAA